MLNTLVPSRRAALCALALVSFFAFGQAAAHAQEAAAVAQAPTAGQLLISEFRYRGPGGENNEYVEIYNNTDAPITVADTAGGGGFGIFSRGNPSAPYCVIPNGTVIPARGHFLCTGSSYSLANYGGTNAAAGNAAASYGLADNLGLALYSSAVVNFPFNISGTRLDSAGPTSEFNPLLKEGTGFPDINASNLEYALVRKLTTGRPQDTQNNETDFWILNSSGSSMCTPTANFQCTLLGAPGPENLASPVVRTSSIPSSLIDPCVSTAQAPNRVRTGSGNSGTLSIRRKFTNNTGGNVTRLRFRIVDVTTFPAPPGTAELRAATSGQVVVSVSAGCGGGMATVEGTTLEAPPLQPFGGGYNSTLSAGTVTLGQPLAPGASVNLQFLNDIRQSGSFRFFVAVEALP